MWKVSTSETTRLFHTEEKAMAYFRETVRSQFSETLSVYTDRIDSYCAEFYPDGAPVPMVQLKTILSKIVNDPTYPEKGHDMTEDLDYFSDERVKFYTDGFNSLFAYPEEGFSDKFIDAEIKLKPQGLTEGCFFYLTDNGNWEMNIEMEKLSEEDMDRPIKEALPEVYGERTMKESYEREKDRDLNDAMKLVMDCIGDDKPIPKSFADGRIIIKELSDGGIMISRADAMSSDVLPDGERN